MPGERTSVYLAADLAAAVKASGTLLAELIRRGLTAGAAQPSPNLCVPKTSSTSSDQAVFVDQAIDVGLPSNAVPAEVDWSG